ncbi:hypothetical protein NHX12_014694, partial [Muraenolepis orangiensis]
SHDGRFEVRGHHGKSMLTISGVGLADRVGGHQKSLFLDIECESTPATDFGRYNCTARNNIGLRHQEFILAQADVPSNPYSVRLSAVCQRLATVPFMKPDSHGGVPTSRYLVQ